MGILNLKRHLISSSSSVEFGTPQCQKLVIDGPALVYHVYNCLLSRMEERFNPVDVLPSPDEVSIGCMTFLLHLRDLGVKIEQICFDGALPLTKRATRLDRYEKSREALARICDFNPRGFSVRSIRREPLVIDARMVFSRGGSAVTLRKLPPPNPFMVVVVVEDLKYRWDWNQIGKFAPGLSRTGDNGRGFPWADITHVVPGEADTYLAEAARTYRASVLTGDSDFLIHDLGQSGSMIFFDSIEVIELENSDGPEFGIRGAELSQELISKKFGVRNLQRLGFELKHSPHTSFQTLIQRCKTYAADEQPSDLYSEFLKEYGISTLRPISELASGSLDPKISELCLQYQQSELRSGSEAPHIYLPLLIENCARRSAWAGGGSRIRALAYSLLDMAFPSTNTSRHVTEYSRRGARVGPINVDILDGSEIDAIAKSVLDGLRSTTICGDGQALINWKTFALSEIWLPSEDNNNVILSPEGMRKFYEGGYTTSRVTWDDIHLTAQVQAVFYSLRILNDLISVAIPGLEGCDARGIAGQLLDALSALPPMRTLFQSRSDMKRQDIPEGGADNAVQILTKLISERSEENEASEPECQQDPSGSSGSETMEDFVMPSGRKKRRRKFSSSASHPLRIKSTNVYDILSQIN